MKEKRSKGTLDLEFLGSIASLVLIMCTVAAFLDYERAPGFFVAVISMGIVINGILTYLRFLRKNYILGAVLALITLALLVLFIMQITMMEGIIR